MPERKCGVLFHDSLWPRIRPEQAVRRRFIGSFRLDVLRPLALCSMMVVIPILVAQLDDFERCRVDLGFEGASSFISSADFLATVVDLDPGDGPAPPSRHRLHRLARLPLLHRNVAIVVRPCGP